MSNDFDYAHSNKNVIWMSQNTNHLPTHSAIQEAINKSSNEREYTKYPLASGLPELRQLILDDLNLPNHDLQQPLEFWAQFPSVLLEPRPFQQDLLLLESQLLKKGRILLFALWKQDYNNHQPSFLNHGNKTPFHRMQRVPHCSIECLLLFYSAELDSITINEDCSVC